MGSSAIIDFNSNVIAKYWEIVFLMLTLLSYSLSISLQNSRLLWCLVAILFTKEVKTRFKNN